MSNDTQLTVTNSMQDITSLAEAFYKSGMFKDTTSAAQAIVKIVAGKELGLGAFYSMTRINMIQGKLGLAAETLGALIKRSNKYNYTVTEHDETKCVIEFTENGKPAYTSTFTIEDAKRANLVKPDGGWTKYPRAMLFSRALSQGARIVAPDVIGGAYTDEELTSIETPKSGKKQEIITDGEFTEQPAIDGEIVESKVKPVVDNPESDKQPALYQTNNNDQLTMFVSWLKQSGITIATACKAHSVKDTPALYKLFQSGLTCQQAIDKTQAFINKK